MYFRDAIVRLELRFLRVEVFVSQELHIKLNVAFSTAKNVVFEHHFRCWPSVWIFFEKPLHEFLGTLLALDLLVVDVAHVVVEEHLLVVLGFEGIFACQPT